MYQHQVTWPGWVALFNWLQKRRKMRKFSCFLDRSFQNAICVRVTGDEHAVKDENFWVLQEECLTLQGPSGTGNLHSSQVLWVMLPYLLRRLL